MLRLILFAALAVTATIQVAFASEFTDRAQASREQYEQRQRDEQTQGLVQAQIQLQKQIYIFAHKHGGMADAGSCNSATSTTCTFFATCFPKVPENVPVSGLGSPSYDIGQCDVTFNDGLACSLNNDWDHLYQGSLKHIAKLEANCYDRSNKALHFLQY